MTASFNHLGPVRSDVAHAKEGIAVIQNLIVHDYVQSRQTIRRMWIVMRGVARSGHSLVAFSRDVVPRAAPHRSRSRPSSAIDPRRARRGRTMPASEASGETPPPAARGACVDDSSRSPEPVDEGAHGSPLRRRGSAASRLSPRLRTPATFGWSPRTWWRGAASASGTSTASAVSSATVGSACSAARSRTGTSRARRSSPTALPATVAIPIGTRSPSWRAPSTSSRWRARSSPWTRATRSAPPPRASPSSTSPHPRRPSSCPRRPRRRARGGRPARPLRRRHVFRSRQPPRRRGPAPAVRHVPISSRGHVAIPLEDALPIRRLLAPVGRRKGRHRRRRRPIASVSRCRRVSPPPAPGAATVAATPRWSRGAPTSRGRR